MLLLNLHLLQIDALRSFIPLRGKYEHVAGQKLRAAFRNDFLFVSAVSAEDDRQKKLRREDDILYHLAVPCMSGVNLRRDKSELAHLGLIRKTFHLLVLFDESGADDTGRHRYHSDAEEGNDHGHDFAARRNRGDVAVTDCQDRRSRPPDA